MLPPFIINGSFYFSFINIFTYFIIIFFIFYLEVLSVSIMNHIVVNWHSQTH